MVDDTQVKDWPPECSNLVSARSASLSSLRRSKKGLLPTRFPCVSATSCSPFVEEWTPSGSYSRPSRLNPLEKFARLTPSSNGDVTINDSQRHRFKRTRKRTPAGCGDDQESVHCNRDVVERGSRAGPVFFSRGQSRKCSSRMRASRSAPTLKPLGSAPCPPLRLDTNLIETEPSGDRSLGPMSIRSDAAPTPLSVRSEFVGSVAEQVSIEAWQSQSARDTPRAARFEISRITAELDDVIEALTSLQSAHSARGDTPMRAWVEVQECEDE